MKQSNGFLGSSCNDSDRIPIDRRNQLLAEFDRSGLSAAAFARQHGLTYTTFCGWRHRQRRHRDKPQAIARIPFVQVELSPLCPPAGLLIEWGTQARLRLDSPDQVPLAARLLQELNSPTSC
jgi:hypothetical protein